MEEEIKIILEVAQEKMGAALEHLAKEFKRIRAGKANPAMLSGVMVDYYGTKTPLTQIANVNSSDAQTLIVQPFEKNMIKEIKKAIVLANLGFNPMDNAENVIIGVPPLTEERRKQLSKKAKSATEDAKIKIRISRKEANNEIKDLDISEDLKKDTQEEIQNLTNDFIKKTDQMYAIKDSEMMKI